MSNGITIDIDVAHGPAEAYLTGRDGDPGLLVYPDAIGLRPQIEEMADRMASWGHVVLVPHVFYREGRAAELAPKGDLRRDGEVEDFFASGVMDRIGTLTPEVVATDAEAWMGALLEHAGSGPVGTTGYCLGAAFAVRLGGQFPERVAAVGGFHGGGLVTDGDDSPHLTVARAQATYCFGHADKDRWMPPEAVARLEEILTQAGRPHVNEVYDGAPHGYSMADTSMYDAAAAERHFAALRELLGKTLR
jgi:carboxymethylenebutenolidase